MAQTAWPFENIDTSETQFSQWARNIGEGVVTGHGLELEPYGDGSGMVVKVKSGQALVRGHYYDNSAEVSVTIATADLSNPRIDSVVLRLDPTANTCVLAVLTGTPDPSPSAPALTQTDSGVYELHIADVAVAAAATVIQAGDVTDQRLMFTAWSADLELSINNAIAAKAPLNSPTFTGTVTLPADTSIGNVSATELSYVDGANSNIQTQLNGKQATITGGATTITSTNLTASRALTSDASGKVAVSAATSTELGYLSGVTSAVQTQLNGKVDEVNGAVTTASTSSTVVRNITLSTADPSGGTDGQVWLKYTV